MRVHYLFEALEIVVDEALLLKVLRSHNAHEGEMTIELTKEQHLTNNVVLYLSDPDLSENIG